MLFRRPHYLAIHLMPLTFDHFRKACFADLFLGPDRSPGFASMNFTRSFSASMYSLFIDSGTGYGLAAAVLIPALLMVPGQMCAYSVNKAKKDPD